MTADVAVVAPVAPTAPSARLSRLLEPTALALIVAIALAVIYVAWSPLAPDVAAQSGRAAAARLTHVGTWWVGWFGGLPLMSYSVVVPPVIAVLGVPLTGGLAVIGTAAAGGPLVARALRPRVGAVALALAAGADVLGGRTTFAVGTAIALASALALQRRHIRTACVLAGLAVLASPLAGLFLGIGALSLLIAQPRLRRPAAYLSGSLLAVGLLIDLLCPGSGRMPFSRLDLLGALCGTAAVAALCPQRFARAAAVVLAGAEVFFFLVPSSVGVNIGRMTAVFGAVAVLAFSPWHRVVAAITAVALTIGPGLDLYTQVRAGQDASARQAFYEPLVHELVTLRGVSGAGAAGARVEVIDPRTHGDSTYVAPVVPIARGWYRQADVADNPLFYEAGALDARSYRKWLDSMAVRWVALPNAPLDYAAVDEARLVRTGLPYLRPVWQNRIWSLYEVQNPRPLADEAVAGPGNGGLTVDVGRPKNVFLRVRWSPRLRLRAPVGVDGARIFDADGWVGLDAPDPGRYVIDAPGLL